MNHQRSLFALQVRITDMTDTQLRNAEAEGLAMSYGVTAGEAHREIMSERTRRGWR